MMVVFALALPFAIIGLVKLAVAIGLSFGLSKLLQRKRPAQEVGRLASQIQLQDSSYGIPVPRIYGGTENNPETEFLWQAPVNATVGAQRQVEKTGGAASTWDAKAESVQTFGYVNAGTKFGAPYQLEFTVRRGAGGCGFTITGAGIAPSGFAYGIIVKTDGVIECWADGSMRFQSTAGAFADGDKLRIEVVVQTIHFYHDDILLTRYLQNALSGNPGPYVIRATVYDSGAQVDSVRVWQWNGTTTFLAPSLEPAWSRKDNLIYLSTGALKKTAGTAGAFDAIAVGAEIFKPSASFRLQFRAPTYSDWIVGVVADNTVTDGQNFDIYVKGDSVGNLRLYKLVSGSPTQIGATAIYGPNDIIRLDHAGQSTVIFNTTYCYAEVYRNNSLAAGGYTGPEYANNAAFYPAVSLATMNATLDQFRASSLTETEQSPPALAVDLGGVKVSGNAIDASEIREVRNQKKIDNQRINEYSYNIDLCLSIGEGVLRLLAMWAGTDLLIDLRGTAEETGIYDDASVDISNGYDFGPELRDYNDLRSAIASSVSARYSQGTPDAYGVVSGTISKTFSTFRFYPGNETQLPDPTFEALRGVGNTPAYRGLSYIVLEKFFFKYTNITSDGNDIGFDYGGIPNFRFLVFNETKQTVEEILVDLSVRSGMAGGEYTYAAGTDVLCRGLYIGAREPARQSMEHLAIAYGLDCYQYEGQASVQKRGSAVTATIPVNKLGFSIVAPSDEPGAEGRGLQKILADESQLPSVVNLNHFDPYVSNFETGSQQFRRGLTSATREEAIDLPVTMTAEEARLAVERVGNEAWQARTGYTFSLSYEYAWLRAGNVLEISDGGITHQLQIDEIEGSAPGALSCKAHKVDNGLYAVIRPSLNRARPIPETPVNISPTIGTIIDLATLRDGDDQPGVYVGAAPALYSDVFRGALIYRDRGDGTYDQITGLQDVATIGTARGDFYDANPHVWDESSVLFIDLASGDLESVTESDVLNGANMAIVGDEVVQFQYAERQATIRAIGRRFGYSARWKIWRFLRGRRGTDDGIWLNNGTHVGVHGDGERFVLIDSAVKFLELPLTERGVSRNYKFAGLGEDVGALASGAFTYQANNLKPLAPVNIAGSRDGSGNLTITWTRRARIYQDLQNYAGVPLDEPVELYSVDIINGATVVRTLPDVTAATASYTAAQQVADFGSAQSAIKVHIYQISARVGRGKKAEAVI